MYDVVSSSAFEQNKDTTNTLVRFASESSQCETGATTTHLCDSLKTDASLSILLKKSCT